MRLPWAVPDGHSGRQIAFRRCRAHEPTSRPRGRVRQRGWPKRRQGWRRSILVLVAFGILAVLGVPLSLSLGLGCAFTLWYYDLPMSMITQTMATSINSFLLIAVPLFVLAGNIMEHGGLSERIFAAADAVVGRFCGGLGHVNILSSFVFGGISGSSSPTSQALGRSRSAP